MRSSCGDANQCNGQQFPPRKPRLHQARPCNPSETQHKYRHRKLSVLAIAVAATGTLVYALERGL